MVPRNAERERRAQERIEARMIRRFEPRLRRAILSQIRGAVNAYEDGRPWESAIHLGEDQIEREYERMYTEAYETIGARIATALDDGSKSLRFERKELPEMFRRAMQAFVRRWTATQVTKVTSTTRVWIAAAVQRGIEEGLSVPEIGGRIRSHATTIAGWRANTIARTEVHSAANAGAMEAAKESGRVRMKNWVHVNDPRTRDGDNGDFDHTNVESVPIDEPFIVDGEELMYPGDPSGSAGNIVNCRCAMTYELRGRE